MNLGQLAWLIAIFSFACCDDSLFWGPYRPSLYFGVRPRLPHSLMTGLMWYRSNNIDGIRNLRHECNMGDDVTYSWTQYDSRLGGIQEIQDDGSHLNLTTEFIKSADGLSWTARVRGHQSPDNIVTTVFYAGLEGDGALDLESMLSSKGITGDVALMGQSPELGRFELTVAYAPNNGHPSSDHDAAKNHPGENSQYSTLNIPTDHVWKAKDIYLTLVQDMINAAAAKYENEGTITDIPAWSILTLANHDNLKGNFHLIQHTFQGPFEFDIVYKPQGSSAKAVSERDRHRIVDAQNKKFNEAFKLQPPYTEPEHHEFARAMISNLEAGIGYFYGDSLVGASDDRTVVDLADKNGLFTCTPTRSFFPRGFYWDEGFHLLGLLDYDLDLVLEIVASWFSLMDEDGWIAREQILGPEARSRVPEEFQVQFPDYANPPTLAMLLAYMGTVTPTPEVKEKLASIYPGLEHHFKWFRTTQRGELLEFDRDPPSAKEAYRWRGRDATHVLTSGMDDYPRASDPHDGELHVDLLSWMGAMARSLSEIASIIGREADAAKYKQIEANVRENLVALHWDPESETFCDVTVDDFEEDVHVCHVGYVSHLPFMLRLINPDDTKMLNSLIAQLRDGEQLWSPFGIRSLSRSDEFYGTEENYWRGPIWVHMNYLVLDALAHYANTAQDAQTRQLAGKTYKELRRNVIDNVYDQWKRTKNVWEQYDSETGASKGAKQFTGWTALTANIMCLPEDATERRARGGESRFGDHDDL